jgi:predicted nuclease of restriction endonuclease-like RecB superfamily
MLGRTELVERVAREFEIHPDELESSLYADLPKQRCITAPNHELPPNELALRTNLMLIQGLMARARSVELELSGNSAAVVRHAKRKGLICVIQSTAAESSVRLSVSGPYSLFRSTLIYGRALGDLVPVLAWCNQFRLSADVILSGRALKLDIRTGDPIVPSTPPKPYDSRLEERFARMFLRSAPNWDLIREPEPIEAGGTIIFPDFAIQHRHCPSRRWLLEIVGYWTPEYLKKKMERLREARIQNLLLCVSDKLNCSDQDLPAGASILRFAKQLHPADVLRAIGDETTSHAPRAPECQAANARREGISDSTSA